MNVPDDNPVVAKNQSAHQIRIMRSDPHADHTPERMPEKYCGSGNTVAKKAGYLFRILRAVVSASYPRRLAMTAKIGREDMPAHAQRRNQRQKYLPAPAESMQQHEWRPIGGAFGIVQSNVVAVEAALD